MTKHKVIVLSVTEQGLSIAEAARRYDVSRRWIHELLRRYRTGGLEAVEPQPKRPKSSPHRTPDSVAVRICELRASLTAAGLDAGPATIAWHLLLAVALFDGGGVVFGDDGPGMETPRGVFPAGRSLAA